MCLRGAVQRISRAILFVGPVLGIPRYTSRSQVEVVRRSTRPITGYIAFLDSS
jgi:hypothetical protein